MLNDWYDGRIDGVYPVHCYTEAVQQLPKDVQDYSQARSDLTRTLQNGILVMTHNGNAPGPNNVIPGSLPSSGGRTGAHTFQVALAGVLILMLAAWTVAAYRRRFGRGT